MKRLLLPLLVCCAFAGADEVVCEHPGKGADIFAHERIECGTGAPGGEDLQANQDGSAAVVAGPASAASR